MQKQEFYIAELISRHLAETLTETETQKLDSWRNSSPDNEALFQKLCSHEHIAQHIGHRSNFNANQGWQQVEQKMNHTRRKQLYLKVARYAAMFLLPLVIGILAVTWPENATNNIAQQISENNRSILPGEKKAILTLANGEVIDLTASQDTRLKEKDGTAIQIDSARVNYQSTPQVATPAREVYNKVEIPRGGEYSLLLSDGTRVHLNSMSSLRFPVHFTGSIREVELQGEAYFEVSKNGKPFIVKTGSRQVEVLGTTFNISAYRGEEYQTTLLTGSVKVHTSRGENRLLKPSEQACIAPDTDEISVRKVDPYLYTSWIQGRIHFKDQRLDDIMKSLARWYDMTVVYKTEKLKNLKFGCNVDRYKDITPFLELLESTGKVTITIKDKTITIGDK